MNSPKFKKTSKFLSYILRHHPESIGLEVDRQGWAHLPSLVEKANNSGRSVSEDIIQKIIAQSDKQRFRLSDDGNYIRAGYGHSIDVDLDLDPIRPPDVLYHGTAKKNLDSILAKGLHPGSRNLVHLSANISDAMEVGSRHGRPYLLTIASLKMYNAGHPFYQSDSEPNIWLVESVPPPFIEK
ncbi:RNA 2'-phosphotransferase [Aliifodinibius sp. S!AR15-10]|uniref:RNA 2'-phosphotransferase n=1 Tax=Aliifodinibius sp. S!AR15-10 TaxID=2950437 RepID=UPI002858D475|nr:RNA 2'-phosphotransferase [Aliifodinibius sp. S!AR15-10]MDR8393965.1 RNA 2'-phosphotransferase [Aliifodinibius sp. S!AR15-10]